MAKKNKRKFATPFTLPRMKVTESLPVDRAALALGVEIDEYLEREREKRFEGLKIQFTKMLSEGNGEQAIAEALRQMFHLERENDLLAWQVLRFQKYRFGRNTEKLTKEELQAFIRALGGTEAEATAQEPTVPIPDAPEELTSDVVPEDGDSTKSKPGKKKRQAKDRTRVVDESKIETVTNDIRVSGDERLCETCGLEKDHLGWVEHDRFEYQPAKLIRRKVRREKCVCKKCHDGVTTAAHGDPNPRFGIIGPSIVARLIQDKCENRMPLYRQRQELESLGLHIPEKTLGYCWSYGMDLLAGIATCVRAQVFAMPIVGVDDTHLNTLIPKQKGTARGHVWCFVGTDGSVNGAEHVAYGFAESWKASEIQPWFSAIDHDIQCDAYAGSSAEVKSTDDADKATVLVAVPDERRLGCAMHIRRKFIDALTSTDKRAAIVISYFQDIYAIEERCKVQGLTAEERTEVRRLESIPILDKIDAWIDEMLSKLLPRSPLYKACNYAKNQRAYLRRCFEDGRFEIDNGRVERKIRPIAVGRRVFMFTGSVRGGERLADAYTLVDNCKLLGIDPQTYLIDVITKIEAGWPASKLSALTPSRWAQDHRTPVTELSVAA